MSAMIAETKDNKIIVTEVRNGITYTYFLVPYVETKDGPQEIFECDNELERIALCISEFNAIPTSAISSFIKRAISLVEKTKFTTDVALKVLETRLEEEKQNSKRTKILQKLPPKDQGH